jgi:CDP-diacylglycerol--serine O-phosphatidyltransferase
MIKLVSVADLISLTNVIFGFIAIIFLISDLIDNEELRLRLSFSFILLALLADGLDGVVARKTRNSDIGEYLESIADMTSLIIAPSIFIYFVYHDFLSSYIYNYIYLMIALVLFLSLGAIRLASFHKMKSKKIFLGLPASVSTIILLVFSYFEVSFILILALIIILSLLMISNIRFPKPGLKINAIAAILIILSIILGKELYGFALILLITAILFYSIIGPVNRKILEKKL